MKPYCTLMNETETRETMAACAKLGWKAEIFTKLSGKRAQVLIDDGGAMDEQAHEAALKNAILEIRNPAPKNGASIAAAERMASPKQIAYLEMLKIVVEPNLTMKRASLLIDLHKSGNGVGSAGGYYTDGSN